MDKFLDSIASLFGRKDSGLVREENRMSALKAASEAAPVSISRPNAPLQTTRREVDSTLKATSMTDQGEQEDFLVSNDKDAQSADFEQQTPALKLSGSPASSFSSSPLPLDLHLSFCPQRQLFIIYCLLIFSVVPPGRCPGRMIINDY